jgi:hypothetical protein
MSNTKASEENVESPSTYGNEAYQRYRKKEKKKDITYSEKEGHNSDISYSKYVVGGEAKEVPSSPELGKNYNFIHKKQQNKPEKKEG